MRFYFVDSTTNKSNGEFSETSNKEVLLHFDRVIGKIENREFVFVSEADNIISIWEDAIKLSGLGVS